MMSLDTLNETAPIWASGATPAGFEAFGRAISYFAAARSLPRRPRSSFGWRGRAGNVIGNKKLRIREVKHTKQYLIETR